MQSELTVETSTEVITLTKQGFLYIRSKSGAIHDKNAAMENIQAYKHLTDIPLPALVDVRDANSADREAAEIYFGKKSSECISKAALLINGIASSEIGNIFAKGKIFPMRAFYDQDSAIEWLHSDDNIEAQTRSEILPYLEKAYPFIGTLLLLTIVAISPEKGNALLACLIFGFINTICSIYINHQPVHRHKKLESTTIIINCVLFLLSPLIVSYNTPLWILLILINTRIMIQFELIVDNIIAQTLLFSSACIGTYLEGGGLLKSIEPIPFLLAISLLIRTLTSFIYTIIRRQVLVENDLHLIKEKALHIAQQKSKFLANMSHEIRTPMNGIIGFTDLVLSEQLTPKQREMTENIKSSGKHLIQILNDILDFSKIEVGKLSIDNHDFDIYACIKDIEQIFSKTFAESNLYLKLHIDNNTPQYITSDSTRIRQIVINLVANGLKFTKDGGVSIYVSSSQINQNQFNLKITIQDTGIGIPQDKQQIIFDSYSQAEVFTTREYGGTGLGLSISQKISNLMGGTLSLKSKENEGSKFTLTIPVISVTELPKHTPDLEPIEHLETIALQYPLKILVVEDLKLNKLILEGFLDKLGYSIDIVSDGQEALEYIQKTSYDMILMDYHMPRLNGYETAKKIRAMSLEKQPTIIAVTASTPEENQNKNAFKEINDFILKPIIFKELVAVIIRNATHETNNTVNYKESRPPEAFNIEQHHSSTIFDKSRFSENFQFRISLGSKLIQYFLDNHHAFVGNITSAIRQNSPNDLEMAAHIMKSAAGHFYNQKISEVLSILEQLGGKGQIPDSQSEIIVLTQECTKLERELKHFLEELNNGQ